MAATRTTLKQYFKKYATPTEEQFAALIDAFVHKDEDSLTQSKIDGLTAALESKVSSSDLASAVATAVEETLQGGNVEVTPAAHEHAIDDVEGLQAFVTKVNNFLESADVSDETINRWAEIETFLTGVTDQETLAGLLLNLKNEILAQIPEPQTGNYLKQISDLDAYTDAQEGEIVQYVGTSTADYTRGFCYERVVKASPITENTKAVILFNGTGAIKNPDGTTAGGPYYCIGDFISNGDNVFTDYKGSYILVHGINSVTVAQLENAEDSGENSVRHSDICSNVLSVKDWLKSSYSAAFDGVLDNTIIWQPIATSPVVS